MLQVREEDIDKITAVFHAILQGKSPDLIALPPDYPDNEIRQAIDYINRFITDYKETANLAYNLGNGHINTPSAKTRTLIGQSLKSLHASLKTLTWTTKQIARGDFGHQINFMGEFSEAFNSMSQQLQDFFDERERTNQQLQGKVAQQDRARRATLNILEDLNEARKEAEEATRLKSDFLANMSSEIHASINAMVDLSDRTLQTELTPSQRNWVENIQQSGRHLLAIINTPPDFIPNKAEELPGEQAIEVCNRLSELLVNGDSSAGTKEAITGNPGHPAIRGHGAGDPAA